MDPLIRSIFCPKNSLIKKNWFADVTVMFAAFALLTVAASTALADIADDEADVVHRNIELMGTDLLDEMAWSWLEKPPVPSQRSFVLADVDSPVGLDTTFSTMVENRLYELLEFNPTLRLKMHHCLPCSRWITKSNPAQTHIARGIDQPETLADMSSVAPDMLGLSLQFEAKGRDLVLRARLFEIKGSQRVVWARSYTTSMSSRRILQEGAPVISLKQARAEQLTLLQGRDEMQVTTRALVRIFNPAGSSVQAIPLPFLEPSIETVLLPNRSFRAGLDFGFSSLKGTGQTWSVGAHFMKLLGARQPSLSKPDLYMSLGYFYMRMRGPAAAVFATDQLDVAQILEIDKEPKATLTGYRLGFELHAKNRLGGMAFIEYMPILKTNEAIKKETIAMIPYHAYGFGGVFRW